MAGPWHPPALNRRTEYKALRRQDRWIVPLLAATIESALARFAAPLAAGGRCLDVGCGDQPLRKRIEALGYTYVSLDVQQNSTRTVDAIGAIDAPLPQALEPGSFDFIVCTEVLEHVPRWPEAFANLARLLRPGGRLLITCPHIWVPHEEPADFHRPTSWALAFHGEQAGLTALEIRRAGTGRDVLGTIMAAVRVRAAPGRPWAWLPAIPVILLRKLFIALLSIRSLDRIVSFPTSLYLSTVVVLEKPH